MQRLHETVVKIASPYHMRILDRVQDIYSTLSAVRKNHADKYGASSVMELYNPHMTLFYLYPPAIAIQKIPLLLENTHYENLICKMDKIIIGKLGYNGNITEVIDIIPL